MRIIRILTAALIGCGAVLAVPSPAMADEVRDSQWYLETLNIAEAHKISTGKGVTVGVIDRGIDASHPDLKDAIKPGISFGESVDPLVDNVGHGTAIAAILAGRADDTGVLGIAPEADIISVNIDWDESQKGMVSTWVAESIRYLVDEGVDVINVSVVNTGDDGGSGRDAIEYAKDHGIPVVASAGNISEGYTTTMFPGAYSDAIPVTGTTPDGSFWDGSVQVYPGASPLAVSAPAVELPAANPGGGYTIENGTSGAAPIVAGTFALVKSVYPDLDWAGLVNRVLGNVQDKGEPGSDSKYGRGIIDPVAALTAEIPGQKQQEPESDSNDSATVADEVDTTGSFVKDNAVLIGAIAFIGVVLLIGLVIMVRAKDKKVRMAAGAVNDPSAGGHSPKPVPPVQQQNPHDQSRR